MIGELLTVPEVASELKVTHESVRRYIREKKLPAKKVRTVGRRKVWGIHPADLEKFNKE